MYQIPKKPGGLAMTGVLSFGVKIAIAAVTIAVGILLVRWAMIRRRAAREQ
ncbi:hypothetical protein ACIO3O_16195 [Streptomyces sp. NPDC087440]|uniref:hypothetical protein n=1 Tax=Streptomyces sp. NPDC087440 TaxID=3365790 RepID=UPI00381C9EA6